MSFDGGEGELDNFRPFPKTASKAFPRKDPGDLAVNRKPFNVRLSEQGWRLADALKLHYGLSGTALVEFLLREHSRTIERKSMEALTGRAALRDLIAKANQSDIEVE